MDDAQELPPIRFKDNPVKFCLVIGAACLFLGGLAFVCLIAMAGVDAFKIFQ